MAGVLVRLLLLAVGFVFLSSSGPTPAQEVTISAPRGVPDAAAQERMKAEAMQRAAMRGRPMPGGPPKPPGASGTSGEKPGDDKKKPDDKDKKDEEKSKGPEPITRPPAADTPADPNELKIRPDKDGKISLQMRGQKWVDVLQMLADWAGLGLDWTELPGDAVFLTTTKKYTLPEARDTFNRMLLDRGYTMLFQPTLGTLSVHKIETLNPALVPRVSPEQLDQRDPYELVKVSFALGDWLDAEEAVTDFEHMKSANGRLKPLKATNRLEVVDAVVNLRQIRDVLDDEGSASGIKQRIRVFPIKYRNASDVDELLRGLLGLQSGSEGPSRSFNPRMMQEMQKKMQQMMQQQQKKGGGSAPKPKPEIRLVVNRRENMIIAHAPPEQMAIIEQTIEAIDIPTEQNRSLPGNLLRWRSYKLASMNPEPLVEILNEIGTLDYSTQIKVDEDNNAIVAYATLADHVTISSLVEKLDGSGRRFYVIRLRRLRADYVAGTIASMMGSEEEDNSRSRYGGYFGYYGRGRQEDKSNKFSVDADVENNWLLLRANELEMEEIEDLLTQLGEIRVPGQNQSTIRYIDVAPGAQTDALLEKIRRIWPNVAPNELKVEPAPEKDEDEKDETESQEPTRPTPKRVASGDARTAQIKTLAPARTEGQAGPSRSSFVQLAQLTSTPASEAEDSPRDRAAPSQPPSEAEKELLQQFLRSQGRGPNDSAKEPNATTPPMPIDITRSPDGRLVISSKDTRALDLLEDLMREQTPPREEYKIFRLQFADVIDVKYVLEDYFEEEEDNNRSRFGYMFFDPYGGRDNKDPKKLSDRPPIKFIDDIATNSIVVQNADEGQLQIIEQLVEFYDKPESPDSQTVRRMKFFPLRYSKAEVVVERVKEVFVDLLTPNDKARQKGDKDRTERVYNYNFGDSLQKVPKFKGQLLITADVPSNTVVVLAPGYVLDPVEEMILHIDQASTPSSTVQVLKVQGLNAAQVQETIAKLIGGQTGKTPGGGERNGKEGERGREGRGGPGPRGERRGERD